MITKFIFVASYTYYVLAKEYGSKLDFYNKDDGITQHTKLVLQQMTMEILVEAKYTVRQVRGIRDEYASELPFQIGIIVGKCREKYKRMMEVYRDINDRLDGRNNFYGPGAHSYKNVHPLLSMQLIQTKEREIDSLIHVLDMIPRRRIKTKNSTLKLLRAGTADEKEKNEKIIRTMKLKEEELKLKMRVEYEQNNADKQNINLKQVNNTDDKPMNWLLNAY